MIILGLIISFATVIFELFTTKFAIVLIPYGIINPLLFLTPRIIYRYLGALRRKVNFDWVLKLEKFGVIILLFNSIGTLFLHAHPFGFQYDRFLHFLMGVVATAVAGVILVAALKRASKYNTKSFLISFSGLMMFVGIFLWELLQYSEDKIFGTKLFFDSMQPISVDFQEDILFGAVGTIVGLIYLNKNYDKLQLLLLKNKASLK